jgi:hypothetical protein
MKFLIMQFSPSISNVSQNIFLNTIPPPRKTVSLYLTFGAREKFLASHLLKTGTKVTTLSQFSCHLVSRSTLLGAFFSPLQDPHSVFLLRL